MEYRKLSYNSLGWLKFDKGTGTNPSGDLFGFVMQGSVPKWRHKSSVRMGSQPYTTGLRLTLPTHVLWRRAALAVFSGPCALAHFSVSLAGVSCFDACLPLHV